MTAKVLLSSMYDSPLVSCVCERTVLLPWGCSKTGDAKTSEETTPSCGLDPECPSNKVAQAMWTPTLGERRRVPKTSVDALCALCSSNSSTRLLAAGVTPQTMAWDAGSTQNRAVTSSSVVADCILSGAVLATTTCALVPWNANALTPVATSTLGWNAKEEPAHGCLVRWMCRASALEAAAPSTLTMYGFGLERCSRPWTAAWMLASNAPAMPTSPAAGSLCPLYALVAAISKAGEPGGRPSTSYAALISIGSPRAVPVPWSCIALSATSPHLANAEPITPC